jgi:dipeptidyl-peptidase-4
VISNFLEVERVPSRRNVRATILAIIAAACAIPLMAQQRSSTPSRALTAADYARAERFMSWNTTPLVYRNGVSPTWVAEDRFWYRVTTAAGNETRLVDPKTGAKEPCALPACAPTSTGQTGRGGARGRGGRGAAAVITSTSPDGSRAVFIRDWNLWVATTRAAPNSR